MLARTINSLFRRDGGRLLAGLIRHLGSFDLAEEALQDAFARALERWPIQGIPDNPSGWICVVAQRRGLDLLRRDRHLALRSRPPSADDLDDPVDRRDDPSDLDLTSDFGSDDDQLRLLFTCCHPALAQSAQIALALRTICQLSTREIARAFVESESTTAQKLVRAKRKIAQARIPYCVPTREALPERLAAVLAVIYLIFNEGYLSAQSETAIRPDLCAEAIRLGHLLVDLQPDQPEAKGLLALMQFHHARRAARIDGDGNLVLLDGQDRRLWDRSAIAAATQLLDTALLSRQPGPYQIQAAIAALHANASDHPATDWAQILALYGALLRHTPTPVVELNAAVALAMASSLEEGLAWVERIAATGTLDDYHLLHAARADLLRRCGRHADAVIAYRAALALVSNAAERNYLQRRIDELGA